MLSEANEPKLVKVLSKPSLPIWSECWQVNFQKPLVRYRQLKDGKEDRRQPLRNLHVSWLNGASFPWDSKALAIEPASCHSGHSQLRVHQGAAPSRTRWGAPSNARGLARRLSLRPGCGERVGESAPSWVQLRSCYGQARSLSSQMRASAPISTVIKEKTSDERVLPFNFALIRSQGFLIACKCISLYDYVIRVACRQQG